MRFQQQSSVVELRTTNAASCPRAFKRPGLGGSGGRRGGDCRLTPGSAAGARGRSVMPRAVPVRAPARAEGGSPSAPPGSQEAVVWRPVSREQRSVRSGGGGAGAGACRGQQPTDGLPAPALGTVRAAARSPQLPEGSRPPAGAGSVAGNSSSSLGLRAAAVGCPSYAPGDAVR